jgi:hypothetical protein
LGHTITLDLPADTLDAWLDTLRVRDFVTGANEKGQPVTSPNFDIRVSHGNDVMVDRVLRRVWAEKSGWVEIQVGWNGAVAHDSVFFNCRALKLSAGAWRHVDRFQKVDSLAFLPFDFAPMDTGSSRQAVTLCLGKIYPTIELSDTTALFARVRGFGWFPIGGTVASVPR